ncbi:MAG: sulfite exporter TauE/SafE family protein [Chlorobi bacterium]|nr:sulfite exporter TauE/SafE family protein [Chlorobiota bacterium]
MDIVFTILVGVITGFSAGMFGIGGALLGTPLLRELVGLPELLALATPLPATLPAAISGSIVYFRKRLLRFDIMGWIMLGGVPFNVIGAWLVNSVSGPVMMVLTGIVLAYSALLFLRRSRGRIRRGQIEENRSAERYRPSLLIGIGAFAGFMAGFLAIGGGMVMVPAFVGLLRLPTKQALATSLVCVAVLSVPGIITHHINGFIDWPTAGILCATVFPLSALGARATTRLHSGTIELIFGIGMLIFAVLFILRNV